jgi:phosphoglycolate phosphatase
MIRYLFIDFDGTLVDSSKRQYNLFVELSKTSISLSDYWNAKRSGVKQTELLSIHSNQLCRKQSTFMMRWLKKIEQPHRLQDDCLFEGVHSFLSQAKRYFQLYCITNRQYRQRLVNQMKNLGIEKYFCNVICTCGKTSKEFLLRRRFNLSSYDIIIGDSDEDVLTGKNLGLITIGVKSGASTEARLRCLKPDIIISSVNEKVIKKLVKKTS